ncbi:hypothetical protein EJB05_35315, partial [Eragrostis curvula]
MLGEGVSEEGARKKAKVTKFSWKVGSEKTANAANPQTSDASAISAPPPPKVSSVQATSVKPPISIKAPVMHSLMEIITNPMGGDQASSVAKVSKASKNAPSNAKIQDKNLAIAAPVFDVPGSKAKIQDKTQDKGLEVPVEA